MLLTRASLCCCALFIALIANATEVPDREVWGRGQLVVNGKPYLILVGELGNSSAGTAAQADSILPQIARMHVNTVLMPVAWSDRASGEGSISAFWTTDGVAFGSALPGGFVVRKLEERRPQLRTCVGEQRTEPSADGDETDILSTLGQK